MDALQMHIETKQRLQKVGMNPKEFFFDEEIDLALNKAQQRELNKMMNSSVQDTQLKASFIAPLIEKNTELVIYKSQLGDKGYEENMVYGLLPYDYQYLLNDRSVVVADTCNPLKTKLTQTLPEYTVVLPFPIDTGAPGTVFYTRVTLSIPNLGVVYDTGSSPATRIGTIGVNDPGYFFHIVSDILDFVNASATDYQLYWEKYRGEYYPNSFILVTNEFSYAGGNSVITTYINDTATVGSSSSVSATTTNYVTHSTAFAASISNRFNKTVLNKSSESEYLYGNNVFYKTEFIEPLSNEADGFLHIYENENFIVTSAYIDYVRKPRTISLPLKKSCEIAPAFHDQIVDLAVEILKLDIADPTYSANVQETNLRHQK